MLQGPAGIVHSGGAKHPHEVAQRQLRQRQRRRQLQQAAGRLIPDWSVFEFFTFVFPSYYFNRSLSLAIS